MASNDPETSTNAVLVVVPIRSFAHGKSRLSPALKQPQRRDLVQSMATSVIGAAGSMPVLVVTNDSEVTDWAVDLGLRTLVPAEVGLNFAANAGRNEAKTLGYERIIVCHADLPDAVDLSHLQGSGGQILIVPDLEDGGSNVISLDVGTDFEFQYGPGSFERHLLAARQSGAETIIVRDRNLSRDLDEPEDLVADAPRY